MASLASYADDVLSAPTRSMPVKMHTEGLSKHYGATRALHPVDLEVRSGELLTLLGPSGSGKTTLLQIVCGLVEPTAGKLFIDSVDRTHALVHQRDIGVVFQNYALFPHLNVFENIAFPLQMRRVDGPAIRRESLSALDRKLRESMQIEIKRIHRETGSTIIFVTHDQEEALALSDRICLMNAGRIEQIGTPEDIYERPRSTFVADFIGISNKLRGRITPEYRLATPDGAIPLPPGCAARAGATEATIVVRPEHIRLADEGGYVSGHVVERIYGGSETRLLVRLASGAVMTVRQPAGSQSREVGTIVSLHWPEGSSRLLDS